MKQPDTFIIRIEADSTHPVCNNDATTNPISRLASVTKVISFILRLAGVKGTLSQMDSINAVHHSDSMA